MAHDSTETLVTKQEFAQLLRAQEHAFSVLTRALGSVVGEERLADALSGGLASLHATEEGGGHQLYAAALLSRALQDLRSTHLSMPDAVEPNLNEGSA